MKTAIRPLPPRRRVAPPTGAALLCFLLAGCSGFSDSNWNPANWFGPSKAPPEFLYVPAADERPMVAQVLSLKVEQSPDGAIIRATGLPPTQGWWQASLAEVDQDDPSKLVYEFRLYAPPAPTPASQPSAREITVAVHVGNRDLDGISTIVVRGKDNALSASR